MPVISAKFIRCSRVEHLCEQCGKGINGPKFRLYGYAEFGDPPYTIYTHPHCLHAFDPKVKRAIEEYEKWRKA